MPRRQRMHPRLDPAGHDSPDRVFGPDKRALERRSPTPSLVNPHALKREAALKYYTRLRKVAVYVQSNLPRRISLKDAADVACLEPKYFSLFFSRKVGVGFGTWLRERRVEAAAELIRDCDDSLLRVAARVGFGSFRSFERAFAESIGIRPGEYSGKVRASVSWSSYPACTAGP